MGGGWTLTMKTSTSSKYLYSSTVWTSSTNANYSTQIDLNVDQDFVSPAFYVLSGNESMLAMGKLINYNSWSHPYDNAKNLANAPTMTSGAYVKGICAAQTNCGTQPVTSLPSGNFQVITSGTYSFGSWNRFGYVNYGNNQAFGSSIRVGFSGDMNDSDSSDTVMGIGLDCINQCLQYSTTVAYSKHNTGSGYYLYKTSATVPNNDKAERAWLWIR